MGPHRAFWLAFASAWGIGAAAGSMLFLGRMFTALRNWLGA